MVQRQCSQCSAISETEKSFCPECGQSYFSAQSVVSEQSAGANGLAIASMVLGIVWLYWVGSILAVIFGHISLNQLGRPDNHQNGRGMAIAGLVLGYIGLGVIALVLLVAAASA